MGKSKFTPGPWEYVPEEDGHSVYDCDCGFHIARATDGLPEIGQTAANAHLIAAAPEMYEGLDPDALEQSAKLLDEVECDASAECLRDIAARQRAALSKARGEG